MDISPTNLPVVDRRVQFDPRSRSFAAVEAFDLVDKPFRSYTWGCDVYNDQGSEGACVGFAWTHELSAKPKVVRRDAAYALKIYNRARQIDPWPGEDYSGTSVLAGVKAVMEDLNSLGNAYIREYRWGFGLQDVMRIVGYKGPVVLGINWYYDMYFPNDKGFITPTGEVVGGHAILANGIKIVKKDSSGAYPVPFDNVDLDKSWVRLHNSWGTGYGIGGDAKITLTDLDKLLRDNGEACIPTLRSFDR
jgi:hypothetical protein